MRENEFFLYINGQRVRVSEEIYTEYKRGEEKERYFMRRLKKGRFVPDEKEGIVRYFPSREVSFEQLVAEDCEPQDEGETPEDMAIRTIMAESLKTAFNKLDSGERKLLYEIFWLGKTERELGRIYQVSHKAIHKRKEKILGKLRMFL